jgi:probable F420-dependent oxidoreductase
VRRVKFGLLYTDLEDVVAPVEFGVRTEAWGFDSLWLTDFVLSPCYEPLIALAAIAQHTSRIELGTAVLVVPYRQPLHLVKAIASLDALCAQRLILGVGLGGNPEEFAAMGADMRERGRRTDESLAVIRRVLDGTAVSHAGRYHRFPAATIGPHAGKRRHVPLWNGPIWRDGFAAGVLRRTALHCDGFVPTRVPVEGYRGAQVRIRDLAAAAKRDPDAIEWGVLLWFHIADDRDRAIAAINAEIARRSGHDQPMEPGRGNAAGTAAECAEVIRAYLDIGITHFVLDPGSRPEAIPQQCEHFAREVLPRLR